MTQPRSTHDEYAEAGNADELDLSELLVTGRLCTPEEVALMLRVSRRTLGDWRAGRGPSDTPLPLHIGGRVLYALRDVNAYLERQVRAAQARRAAGA